MRYIKVSLADWLYNAGIIGLVNILQHAKDEIDITGQDIVFKADALENFEEKYFKYLIDTYESSLSWYKVVSFESFIKKHEDENFESFDEKTLDVLNQYIGSGTKSGSVKYYLNSNSYKAAFKLTDNQFDIVKAEKDLNQIKTKKNEKLDIQDVKEVFSKIKAIISYCKDPNSKKYLAGKNIIYTIIKNAWNGVAFLNAQTKIPDMYIDYKEYFVDKTLEYLKQDLSKHKYNCFMCNNKIKDMSNDLSFLNMTGFDTNRKPSHVWNFINDIVVCPVCKLVYSCIPAGFSYVYGNGIFINENQRVENSVRINYRIKHDILHNEESKGIYNAFGTMIRALYESINDSEKYELADIQVVRYEDEKYRFNLLSKNVLKVLYDSRDELNSIIKTGFQEVNTFFRLYDEVMKKLLNNENLFILIHKVITIKISKPQDARYNESHIRSLINVNLKYMKGVGYMEGTEKDIVKTASGAGYYLREAYKSKNSENKLNGISYRLLNALKTNNKNMFMDTILNCYLYTNKPIPTFITDCLKDDNVFKTIGYAFVTGLIDGKKSEITNGGDK
ncbi:MAG: type I-B CRISPR-associated protein Cas8b1/Cst1 [Bacillota bacterium]